ncbi:WD domain, G-beta repeat [Musa troglodytarum]|uniref:WD domain, G-beta repeat n=2 Tax=Musa troglodytarum TaxID=320322 RepID=A0A9E7LDR8_9LILI|nr:WD domain, G-beta repeat [Musa troglodytarum]
MKCAHHLLQSFDPSPALPLLHFPTPIPPVSIPSQALAVAKNQSLTAMAGDRTGVWVLFLLLLWLATAIMHGEGAPVGAPAPSPDCSSALLDLADCLSYVENGSTVAKPEGQCCSGLKKVVKEHVICLCDVLKQGPSLGVNLTKALTLPSACGLSTPPFSKCNISIAGVPAAAPDLDSECRNSKPTNTANIFRTISNSLTRSTFFVFVFFFCAYWSPISIIAGQVQCSTTASILRVPDWEHGSESLVALRVPRTGILVPLMEVRGGRGRRLSSRETSPDRARLGCSQQEHKQQQQRSLRPLRKVQIIYYLSRNGQLEHPHFVELPYLPNQQLRLRDVIERLTLLRGRGMPALFSWSCKRSYKNGYVWNDLAENDVIFPADGVEYVLKGSEIIPGTYERFRHVAARSRRLKALPAPHKLHLELEEDEEEEGDLGADEEGAEEVRGGKRNVDGARHSRRSCGVSTEEIERTDNPTTARSHRHHHHGPMELPLDDSSPPSSTSSDKAPTHAPGSSASRRFEDADPAPEPGLTRNSVLLQLIACGSAALKGSSRTSGGTIKTAAAAGGGQRNKGIHRGVVSRLASRAAEDEVVRCVQENPRFCHPLVEDKEYFSGSIVEGSRAPPEPSLKKSSSYNEERSSKLGIGEGKIEVDTGGVKGKCLPGRRQASGKQQ